MSRESGIKSKALTAILMNMRNTIIFLVLVAVTFTTWSHIKIPPTRVRVLYDTQNPGVSVYSPRDPASEVPAECVLVEIQAWGKIPRSERKTPRRYGESKWRKTVSWYFYVQTSDGWLTIPEVSDMPIDNLEIWITPPAGGIAKCDCAVDDKRILPVSPGIFQCSLDERTFSKFVALPEEKRVLLAKLPAEQFQGGVVSFPHKYNYAEALWVLQWCELNMRYWPLLRSTAIPDFKPPKDPLYKDEYFWLVKHCLYYIQESLVGMPMPDWESAKGWKPMTDEEKKNLKARLSAMICKELKEKKEAWKVPVMMIPKEVVSDPLFSEVHCDDLEWQEGKFDDAEDLLLISELEIAQADSTSDKALPKIIKEVLPGYPPIALNLGLTGIVDVEIWVNEEGAVDSAYIVDSSNPIFNDTVYENIGKLKFSPAINSNGERIRSKTDRRINFNIHNQEEQKVAILYRNNTKLTRWKPLIESDPVAIRAAYEELIPQCVNMSTLERIVKLHPRGAIADDAHLSMARLSWMNKDENSMIRHLKAAFDSKFDPDYPVLKSYCSRNHACIMLAEISRKKGDYTLALDYYTKWSSKNGLTVGLEYFNYEREYRISECLVALGQTDKALSSYILPYLCNQTVLGVYPGDTRMPEMAVSIYEKKGEIRKLLDLLRPYTQKQYYEMAKIAYELAEKKFVRRIWRGALTPGSGRIS